MGASVSFLSKKNPPATDVTPSPAVNPEVQSSQLPSSPQPLSLANPHQLPQPSSSSNLQVNISFEKPPTGSTRLSSRNNSFRESAPLSSTRSRPSSANDFHSHIPHTPVCTNEKETYKYYCPLCMEYYKKILKSSLCCNQYICFTCSISYFDTKLIDFNEIKSPSHLLNYKNLLVNIACPHCTNNGFVPIEVQETEDVKDYSMKRPDDAIPKNDSHSLNDPMKPSPLKIGESFENMKRKMIQFQINRTNSSNTSTTSSSVALGNGIAGEDSKTEEIDPDLLISEDRDQNFDEVSHLLPVFTSTMNNIEEDPQNYSARIASGREQSPKATSRQQSPRDTTNPEDKDSTLEVTTQGQLLDTGSVKVGPLDHILDNITGPDVTTPMISTRNEGEIAV